MANEKRQFSAEKGELTMADREKLIELSDELRHCAVTPDCGNCKRYDEIYETKCVDSMLLEAAELLESAANGVTIQRWIPVTERLPDSQTPVLVVAVSKGMGLPYVLRAAHINHYDISTDEYGWTDGEYETEYDEENDCFWIAECWYECNAVGDNENWVLDNDYTVTHWMPLPQPPKGE